MTNGYSNTSINLNNSFLCSFDISSLYINVSLKETIAIWADALYRSHLDPHFFFPETVFLKLMYIATKRVQFSCNNIMYQQIDGIVIGSSLDAAMTYNLVGFQEEKLFEITDKPFYVR